LERLFVPRPKPRAARALLTRAPKPENEWSAVAGVFATGAVVPVEAALVAVAAPVVPVAPVELAVPVELVVLLLPVLAAGMLVSELVAGVELLLLVVLLLVVVLPFDLLLLLLVLLVVVVLLVELDPVMVKVPVLNVTL
jgi:hypothetical protein